MRMEKFRSNLGGDNLAMLDETTVGSAVESPMESWQHVQNWRAHDNVFERIREVIRELREQVSPEPRRLDSYVVISRVDGTNRFQVYLPGFGVAGEGRCLCEASLEANHAFLTLLESALENRTWKMLPAPDRSFRTRLAALKTSLYLRLWDFLSSRLPVNEASEAEDVRSALTAATS